MGAAATWDESEHPRDHGKFTDKGGGGAATTAPRLSDDTNLDAVVAGIKQHWPNAPVLGVRAAVLDYAAALHAAAGGEPLHIAFDPDGLGVRNDRFHCYRSLPSPGVMYCDYLRVKAGYEGRGIGRAVERATDDFARAMGAHALAMDATSDAAGGRFVGAYVWCTQPGWQWEGTGRAYGPELQAFRGRQVKEFNTMLPDDAPKLPDDATPQDVAGYTHHGVPFGKNYLLGFTAQNEAQRASGEWQGSRDLHIALMKPLDAVGKKYVARGLERPPIFVDDDDRTDIDAAADEPDYFQTRHMARELDVDVAHTLHAAGDFDEQLHPRDDAGKFASGGGGGGAKKEYPPAEYDTSTVRQLAQSMDVPLSVLRPALDHFTSALHEISGEPVTVDAFSGIIEVRNDVVRTQRSLDEHGRVLMLDFLRVDDAYQHKGIGVAVHRASERLARELGASAMATHALSDPGPSDPDAKFYGAYVWSMQPGWRWHSAEDGRYEINHFNAALPPGAPKLPMTATPHDLASYTHPRTGVLYGKHWTLGDYPRGDDEIRSGVWTGRTSRDYDLIKSLDDTDDTSGTRDDRLAAALADRDYYQTIHMARELGVDVSVHRMEAHALRLIRLAAAATKTVCVDFDGTLTHDVPYTPGPATAPPTRGAVAALSTLRRMGLRIVVLTARPPAECYAWLTTHGALDLVDAVTNVKPPAFAYVDDRGVHFDGSWEKALDEVRAQMRRRNTPQSSNDDAWHAAEFDESEHPRGDDGRFATGGVTRHVPPPARRDRTPGPNATPPIGSTVRVHGTDAKVINIIRGPESKFGSVPKQTVVVLDQPVRGQRAWLLEDIEIEKSLSAEAANCGIGPDGFEPGNDCAKGDGETETSAPEPTLRVREVSERLYTRGQDAVELHHKLNKVETGALGERLVLGLLRKNGIKDAKPLNVKLKNFPVDLVQDHEVIEVKAGLVSNAEGSRQWRLTIGEPSDEEKALIKRMTPAQKERYNEGKQHAIHTRKAAIMRKVRAVTGKDVKAATMTLIIDPDRRRADVFRFDGFHDRIGWHKRDIDAHYVTTLEW